MTPAKLRDLRNLYTWSLAKEEPYYYATLAMNNIGLGTEFASRKFRGVFEQDEILSMTYHALCKAAKAWNPSIASFATFANFYLRNEFNVAPSQIDAFRSRPIKNRPTTDRTTNSLEALPVDVLERHSAVQSQSALDLSVLADVLMEHGVTKPEWRAYEQAHLYGRPGNADKLAKIEAKIRTIIDDLGYGLYD